MTLATEIKYYIKSYLLGIDSEEGIDKRYNYNDDLTLAEEVLTDKYCLDYVYSEVTDNKDKGKIEQLINVGYYYVAEEGIYNQSKYTKEDLDKALHNITFQSDKTELSEIIFYCLFHQQILKACTEYLIEYEQIKDIKNNREIDNQLKEATFNMLDECNDNTSIYRHFGFSDDETDFDRIIKKIMGSYEIRYNVIPEVARKNHYSQVDGNLIDWVLYDRFIQVGDKIIRDYFSGEGYREVELSDEEYDEGFDESQRIKHKRRLYY